jgi:AraC family transcriptional regulator
MAEIQRSDETVCYGYAYCLPEGERDRPDEVGYVAGVPVADDAPVPEGMVAKDMAGGLYAVFEHHGPIWTFDKTLHAVHRDWLPGSGYVGNGIADLERYDERWTMDGEDSVFEYWVGIKTP